MATKIRYMGAKHNLAPSVAEVIGGLPDGPCLDLFSGMCSVAGALADSGRQAWCNDKQRYARLVARALVSSEAQMPEVQEVVDLLAPAFERNLAALEERFGEDLREAEEALGHADDHASYASVAEEWSHAGNCVRLEKEARELSQAPATFPYRLATITFSHGYFGLRQAAEIDSIRYAIDEAKEEEAISSEVAQWCLVALLQTASLVVNAPGHFAQYLRVKRNTYRRIRSQRLRSAWEEFPAQLTSVTPHGSVEWRGGNRVFNLEASELLKMLNNEEREEERPRVVYADPPYSKAQYSRYYHVLETLTAYDYPEVKYKGRYRCDRFTTPFSHLQKVEAAFDNLVSQASALGASFVLSYPSNGRLYEAGGDPAAILEEYYGSVEVEEIAFQHSTMGGAPGRAKSDVEERIFEATRPL